MWPTRSMWREASAVQISQCYKTSGSQVLALVCGISTAAAVAAPPESVWVFTTQQLPAVQRLDLATEVFVLDSIDTPLKNLSFQNPKNEAAARQHAMAIIQSPEGQAVLAQLKTHAQAVAIAWQSGITKLPAVLVDGDYVVYGEYDVQVAIDHIMRYRHEQ